MEGEAARADRRRKEDAKRRKAEQEDFWLMVFAIFMTIVLTIVVVWGVLFFMRNP